MACCLPPAHCTAFSNVKFLLPMFTVKNRNSNRAYTYSSVSARAPHEELSEGHMELLFRWLMEPIKTHMVQFLCVKGTTIPYLVRFPRSAQDNRGVGKGCWNITVRICVPMPAELWHVDWLHPQHTCWPDLYAVLYRITFLCFWKLQNDISQSSGQHCAIFARVCWQWHKHTGKFSSLLGISGKCM